MSAGFTSVVTICELCTSRLNTVDATSASLESLTAVRNAGLESEHGDQGHDDSPEDQWQDGHDNHQLNQGEASAVVLCGAGHALSHRLLRSDEGVTYRGVRHRHSSPGGTGE